MVPVPGLMVKRRSTELKAASVVVSCTVMVPNPGEMNRMRSVSAGLTGVLLMTPPSEPVPALEIGMTVAWGAAPSTWSSVTDTPFSMSWACCAIELTMTT